MRHDEDAEMTEYFAPIRERIVSALETYFDGNRQNLARINELGRDVADRLLEFALQGKMIRGCLVHLGYVLSHSSQ